MKRELLAQDVKYIDKKVAVLGGSTTHDIAMMLDTSFGIAVRAGLHCAPYAHQMLGTLTTGGTVRVSPGYFTTNEEIEHFIEAVREIARI